MDVVSVNEAIVAHTTDLDSDFLFPLAIMVWVWMGELLLQATLTRNIDLSLSSVPFWLLLLTQSSFIERT